MDASGSLVYTYRWFSKSVPLKRMTSSKNIFVWFCGVLICQWGADTPQNKILRGIRPCRTRPCGVSDPAELSLAGYQAPQNNGRFVYILLYTLVLRGLIHRRTMSCGVWYPAEQSPVGYQTPRNNIQKRISLQIRKRIQKYFNPLAPGVAFFRIFS